MHWNKTKVVWLLAKSWILGKLLIDYALRPKYLKGDITPNTFFYYGDKVEEQGKFQC